MGRSAQRLNHAAVELPMTTPDVDPAAGPLSRVAAHAGPEHSEPTIQPSSPQTTLKIKIQTIRVSPAVLDAAGKNPEDVLRDCGTSLNGLAQAEAETRARTEGSNEIARVQQRWPARVLKIVAREIPLRDLVPGDIVKLAAGDMIPGDVRLLSAKDLFLSQGTPRRPFEATLRVFRPAIG